MPRGDRTGPGGQGPMTGRGMGYCAGFNHPGFTAGGRGGRGWRNMYYATGLPGWARTGYTQPPASPPPPYRYNQEQEKEDLKNEAEMLKQHLDNINRRLEQLEKEE